ncbi:MAG: SMC-Scp complex subunit ScpB [Deltaproteobacteria bacterium]|nr:SMC-Scp complex subunit ScpB [Deltaproteobacteria bacterium]
MDLERVKSIVEALIFVSEEPVPMAKIRKVLDDMPAKEITPVIEALMADYAAPDRGIELEEVADGFQFRTKPENVEWVKRLVDKKPQKLSKAALETLAIVAYNQPCTRPEIEAIRGVDCGSAVNALLDKNMVRILGRKDVPGKPFIYGTTKEFLELFNLKDLSSLPTLTEITDLDSEQIEEFQNPGGMTPDDDQDDMPDDGADEETDEETDDVADEDGGDDGDEDELDENNDDDGDEDEFDEDDDADEDDEKDDYLTIDRDICFDQRRR